jgi:hypothetical protein
MPFKKIPGTADYTLVELNFAVLSGDRVPLIILATIEALRYTER